jgi:nitroimidazol reductase NimA-like FMN-containing flavoprotein (pyridoxamine 5'-phosphate oxidase superfamily)
LEESARRTARVLSDAEVKDFVKAGYWAVLALAVDDEPYGVPIIYGYDESDNTFYIANGPGKKIEMALANRRCTLTIVEVEEFGKRWRSVIVKGNIELIDELPAKLHAFNTLRKQMPESFTPRMRDAAKLAMAKVIRIIPVEVTGKAIGY